MIEKVAPINFWHKDQDIGIKRKELSEVMPLLDIRETVFVLTGVRRCGKSYLVKQILAEKISNGLRKEQTLYINFEDEDIEPFIARGIINKIYSSYRSQINPKDYSIIVLDEVHKVPEWERWVRTMIDRKENVKIIVTGSGSSLGEKTPSLLTGRKISYKLFPLSFQSFLIFKGIKIKKYEKYLSYLEEYLKYGGFPLAVLTELPIQKYTWLQQTYTDILTKDILIKFKLREELILKRVAYLTLNSFAKIVSIRRVVNSIKSIMKLKISPSTVSYYFDYFTLSNLFYFIPIFSYNIKDQEQYPKKVYCVDTGIINSVLKSFSENLGRLMENLVAIQLLRKNSLNENFWLAYWKDTQGREVDFIIKQGTKVKQLIQVTYASGKDEIDKREIRALLKASELLKCRNLLVITWDYEAIEQIKGKQVKFMPLWKWLLKKS